MMYCVVLTVKFSKIKTRYGLNLSRFIDIKAEVLNCNSDSCFKLVDVDIDVATFTKYMF